MRNCAFICRKKGEEMWFWQPFVVCQISRWRTLYRTFYDWYAFSAPELCKNKYITNYTLKAEKSLMFQISAQAKYTHFHNRLLFFYIKKYINIYKTKYHRVLNKNISGFRKYRPHGDMGKNYVLSSGFQWPCWPVCFVDFDYFLVQIMFKRLWRQDCTPLQHAIYHCNGNWISMCTLAN